MTQNYIDVANRLVQNFEESKLNFIDSITRICKNTFYVNTQSEYGKSFICINNDYLKFTTTNYPNAIMMKPNNIDFSMVEYVGLHNKICIYKINEVRGIDATIDIVKKSENEFEIIYDIGCEGAGNTYRYAINKQNLLYILEEIKKLQ